MRHMTVLGRKGATPFSPDWPPPNSPYAACRAAIRRDNPLLLGTAAPGSDADLRARRVGLKNLSYAERRGMGLSGVTVFVDQAAEHLGPSNGDFTAASGCDGEASDRRQLVKGSVRTVGVVVSLVVG
jgi:hypothetical protein